MSSILGGDADLVEWLANGWAASSETALLLPCLDRYARPDPLAAMQALPDTGKVLIVSSSEAQPPIFAHPGHVAERSADALSGRHAGSDRWCHYEKRLIEAAEERGLDWRIVRPAPVILEQGRDLWSRRFRRRRIVTPAGFSPPVQYLHPDDLQDGLRFAADHFDELPPVSHLAPEDAMPLRKAFKTAGVRRLGLPFALLWLWAKLCALFGSKHADPASLDRLRYSFTVSGDALAKLGWRPRYGTAAALSDDMPVDLRHDPFGLDLDVIDGARRTVFRFFHDLWWRVDVHGAEHVPKHGPAILMGVHRGLVPFDAMLALHKIVGESGRVPRFLIHPALLRFPFIGDFMRGLGGVVACKENANWVLERGEILGLFPEGVRGAFAPYRDAYTVQRFGRAEFVHLSVRHRAPCSLFVTLGSAEVFPILSTLDWRAWKRWSGWPTFPLTPTPIPLPVKWHTLFLPPLVVETKEGASKADARTVKRYATFVHGVLEQTLHAMRDRRRSWFSGRVLDPALIEDLSADVSAGPKPPPGESGA